MDTRGAVKNFYLTAHDRADHLFLELTQVSHACARGTQGPGRESPNFHRAGQDRPVRLFLLTLRKC
jgi:hypothetical protein